MNLEERAREYVRKQNEGFVSGGGNPRPIRQRDLVTFAQTIVDEAVAKREKQIADEFEQKFSKPKAGLVYEPWRLWLAEFIAQLRGDK